MKPLGDNNRAWLGKATGAALGLLGGGPFGLVVGAIAGHMIDRVTERAALPSPKSLSTAQETAFFRIAGYMSKVDGRVSEAEIQAATKIMVAMSLSEARKQEAIRQFNFGKQTAYEYSPDVTSLQHALSASQKELMMSWFVGLSLADGKLVSEEKQLLHNIGAAFSLSRWRLAWMIQRNKPVSEWEQDSQHSNKYKRQQNSQQGRREQQGSQRDTKQRSEQNQQRPKNSQQGPSADGKKNTGQQKYRVTSQEARARQELRLDIHASISIGDIKKAYRRCMSELHPDKMMARGASETAIRAARDRIPKVREAYEFLLECRAK
ncbi:MAG: TerB family tellurite resistance protein [Oleibacter sp.]|nr:TerB family tellurite resistance protein [Thalassolituus sp.]